MKTVYKFPLSITTKQFITVKTGSIPLHVGLDPSGVPCIWVKCNTETPTSEGLEIRIIGTGHEIPYDAQIHIGSFVQGVYVWHVFTPDKDFPI